MEINRDRANKLYPIDRKAGLIDYVNKVYLDPKT